MLRPASTLICSEVLVEGALECEDRASWMFRVRTFEGGGGELLRRGRRKSWREPITRRGFEMGRWEMASRRARSWARARAVSSCWLSFV